MPPHRIGTLTTLGLALYERRDGSLFFLEDGRRVDLHGNQRWTSVDGRHMRGHSQIGQIASGSASESMSSDSSDGSGEDDDDLEAAIAASLETEESQIEAAIRASLHQDVPPSYPTPPSVPPTASSAAPASCSVCLEDISRGQPARALRCGHAFHRACIDRWLRSSRVCPVCRENA
jgi:hypothetical protein